MKALLEYNIPKEIDKTSLFTYFQLNYIPSPYSIFRNVKKLNPGTYMTVKKGIITEKEYYKLTLPFGDINILNIGYDEAKKKIIEILDNSISKRLISDVPLGAFLSGGLDSSTVVNFAKKSGNKFNLIFFRDIFEVHFSHLWFEIAFNN